MSSDLQTRLYNYESFPPEKVWTKIDAALDDVTPGTFPDKLYAFEQAPPAGLWEQIEAGLDQDLRAAPPVRRRLARPVRFAIAAAALIGLAVSIRQFTGNRPETAVSLSRPATAAPLPPPPKEQKPVLTAEQPSAPASAPLPEGTGPEKKRDLTRASFRSTERRPLPPSVLAGAKSYASNEVTEWTIQQLEPEQSAGIHQLIHYPVSPDRYLVYSDDNGHAIKLSKKLFDLIACSDEDPDCKQHLQQLQQKLAATAPLPTDFTGMMEMLRSLIENQ